MLTNESPPIVSTKNFDKVSAFGSDADNTAFGSEKFPEVSVSEFLEKSALEKFADNPYIWIEVLSRDSWLYLTLRLAQLHGSVTNPLNAVLKHAEIYSEFLSNQHNSTASSKMIHELMILWTENDKHTVTEDEIKNIVNEIPIRQYVIESLNLAKELGIDTFLFTSSYNIYANLMGEKAGFQNIYYNPTLSIDYSTRVFTGFTTQPNDSGYKKKQVSDFLKFSNLSPDKFMFTGDGYTDEGVMQIDGIVKVAYGMRNEKLLALAEARVDSFYDFCEVLKTLLRNRDIASK